jgi:predicted HicB family RNase H-like nuclease
VEYKGYTGAVEIDEKNVTIWGHVIGLRGAITFQGDTAAQVIQAFHDSVDDYLEFCAQRGKDPERPQGAQATQGRANARD